MAASPVTAQAFFVELARASKFDVPIGQFARNVSSEAVAQKGSFIYEEDPDFEGMFTKIRSLYFTTLVEALRRVSPVVMSKMLLEQSWTEQPRGMTEIVAAEEQLYHTVWYNRHWNRRIAIERGEIVLVDHETFPKTPLDRTLDGPSLGAW